MWRLDSGVNRSKVKVIWGMTPKLGETLWTLYLKNQWREFHLILTTDVIRLLDVLVRLWGQRSRSQPAILWTPYLKHQSRDLQPILVTDVLWFVDVLIRFWGQKVKGQGYSRQWPEKLVNTISQRLMKGLWPNFGHRCTSVCRCAD